MPIFFQQQINDTTRLGIWKVEETEAFFRGNVPLHRDVTHPKKRLQHLAGRFLLQFLFPGFPYELVEIADTRKPFIPGEQFHFSISHCGDYAAAIVSTSHRVGIDIEIPSPKLELIRHKFLSPGEQEMLQTLDHPLITSLTLLWSVKEAVFKWYGLGSVDFREHIRLSKPVGDTVPCFFEKTSTPLEVHTHVFDEITFAWVTS